MSKTQQSTQLTSLPKYVRFSDDVTYHEPAIIDFRSDDYYYRDSDYEHFRETNKHIVSVMKTCTTFSLASKVIEKIIGESVRGLEISCRREVTQKIFCKDLSIQAVL